jgi:hypothetical protein
VIAGSQKPVIGIEQHELFPDRPTKTVDLAAIVKDEVQPVSNDCVHHNVEDGGGHNVPLRDTSGGWKRHAKVPALLRHDQLSVPELT